MKRLGLFFVVFVLLASGVSRSVANNSPSQPDTLPAPIPGAPKPTLQVTPSHGLPGAALTVSGQGVSPYPGVRLVWLDEDTTATLKVVDLTNNNYNTTIYIPGALSAGTGKVCAAVTGTPQAAFECVNITINAPAPGRNHPPDCARKSYLIRRN